MEHCPNDPITILPHSEFQVQALLERVLRRPLWRVSRDGSAWLVRPTAHESPIPVPVEDLDASMVEGNFRATTSLQLTLLLFRESGIPDMNGEDITGRVTPPPRPSGFSLLRVLFPHGSDDLRSA